MIARFLDWLWGARCICGQRIYPRDAAVHWLIEHAGDRHV